MKPEKWVAVHTQGCDDWSEATEVVGVFDSEAEAERHVKNQYWSSGQWNAVRIELPEYDKWA